VLKKTEKGEAAGGFDEMDTGFIWASGKKRGRCPIISDIKKSKGKQKAG